MSQFGLLTFYRVKKPKNPKALFADVIDLLQPDRVIGASRAFAYGWRWIDWIESLRHRPGAVYELREPCGILEKELGTFENPKDVVPCYKWLCSLHVTFGDTPMGRRIGEAVEREIPREIRGHFVPWGGGLTIGHHDLFETTEHEDGYLLDRCFLSIEFGGDNSPNHWQNFREQVFQLNAVRAAKAELEAVTGPLRQCICWNV